MNNKKYRPPKDRFAIRSFIARTLALTPNKFFIGKVAFKLLIWSAPLGKVPVLSRIYKKAILMSPSDHSQGYSVPLNVEIGESVKQAVLPANLMKKAVRNAKFRAIMHKCICRDAQHCENYPTDLGCVFLGDAARICVKNGIASAATEEECISHIDRAARHGLSGQALWVEVEKYLWGFENRNATRFLEFCFCCPCCCTGFKFADRTDRASRLLFHRSSGWRATIDVDRCVNCMACHEVCPRHAIDIDEETPKINEDCGGCGLCVSPCAQQAITLYQVSSPRTDIKAYFEEIDLEI